VMGRGLRRETCGMGLNRDLRTRPRLSENLLPTHARSSRLRRHEARSARCALVHPPRSDRPCMMNSRVTAQASKRISSSTTLRRGCRRSWPCEEPDQPGRGHLDVRRTRRRRRSRAPLTVGLEQPNHLSDVAPVRHGLRVFHTSKASTIAAPVLMRFGITARGRTGELHLFRRARRAPDRALLVPA